VGVARSCAWLQVTYSGDFLRLLRVNRKTKCKEQSAIGKDGDFFLHVFCLRILLSLLTAHHSSSFDDYVRPREHVRRNRQADLMGSLEINNKLKLLWLLDGKVGGVSAFQDLVDIRSGASVQVGHTHAIRHKPPGFYIFSDTVHRREPALCRKFDNPC